MPLIGQARLETGRMGAREALEAGIQRFARSTRAARLDVWLAWSDPGALQELRAHLPEGFEGYFVQLTGRAEARDLERWRRWIRELRGGRLRIESLLAGRRCALWADFDGVPAEPADHELHDPRRTHLLRRTPRVGFTELAPPEPDADRLALAAGRVRHAFEATGLADFGFECEAVPSTSPWGGGPCPALKSEQVALSWLHETPLGLSASVAAAEERAAVFRCWLKMLDRLDLMLLEARGPLHKLSGVLDALELSGHPDRPGDVAGVSTFEGEALPIEVVRALLDVPGLCDWGLRWSGLDFELSLPARCETRQSYYFCRSDGRRVHDTLRAVIDLDDPDEERFRRARRELGRLISPELAKQHTWTCEGPVEGSPRAERYAALGTQLRAVQTQVLENPTPLPQGPRRNPALLRWLQGLAFRGGQRDFDMAGLTAKALAQVAPGFDHDRQAHATSLYFVEFVRATEFGFQRLRFRRGHAPPGHTVQLSVSPYRWGLADLEPGPEQQVPGLAMPLADLVPERPGLAWSYTSHREAAAALADTVAIIKARALPFFDGAETVLEGFQ